MRTISLTEILSENFIRSSCGYTSKAGGVAYLKECQFESPTIYTCLIKISPAEFIHNSKSAFCLFPHIHRPQPSSRILTTLKVRNLPRSLRLRENSQLKPGLPSYLSLPQHLHHAHGQQIWIHEIQPAKALQDIGGVKLNDPLLIRTELVPVRGQLRRSLFQLVERVHDSP